MSVKRYGVGVDGVDPNGNLVKYTDYAALEARCAALAAENAGLKAAHADAIGTITKTINRGSDVYSDTPIKFSVETPATDAFLAEVRAQGVGSAVETITVHMNPRHLAVAEVLCVLRTHAEQLRKGVI